MAGRSRSTFGKRQKEQKRLEKRQEKTARKEERKQEKGTGPEIDYSGMNEEQLPEGFFTDKIGLED